MYTLFTKQKLGAATNNHSLYRPMQDVTGISKTVAVHFVLCPLRNLPLRTTKNNRPTSSYHLYLPARTTSTYQFVPG